MIPIHVSLPLEVLERTLCREAGHNAIIEDTPVSTFYVCLRCRKFWR